MTLCAIAQGVTIWATVGASGVSIACRRWFEPTLSTIMQKKITLSDYLTEAQLRKLYGVKKLEQKKSQPIKHEELTGVAAIRAKVQWQRHKRQAGEWESRKPYLSNTNEAIARYERAAVREHLESGKEMFFIGQGQSTRKKSDIRANAIKGDRRHKGGRIVHRPFIKEKSGEPIFLSR